MPAQKSIPLLDETLEVRVKFDAGDRDLMDNICLEVIESCPDEEKIFKHDETNLYITRVQALELAQALISAVKKSETLEN